MIARNKTSFVTTILTGGMLIWACGPAAAETFNGKVLGGGQPITNSTVTLWAAGEGAPQQLGQARTNADGGFTINSTASLGDASLYLIAKGGQPKTGAQGGDNPAIALLAGLKHRMHYYRQFARHSHGSSFEADPLPELQTPRAQSAVG
jgi:hypothetical protein